MSQTHSRKVIKDEYVKFYLRKSSQDMKVERQFQKVDETLSYIGGLFSILVSFMIFLSLFNGYSYELDMIKGLYSQNEN